MVTRNSGLPSVCVRSHGTSAAGNAMPGEADGEVGGHGLGVQGAQRQAATWPSRCKSCDDRAQRMLCTMVSTGRNVPSSRSWADVAAPRQERHQVQRRMIAPVQVFEDQDQRGLGGQRLDQFGTLAQHPLPRGPLQFLLQVLPVRLG